MNEISWIGRVFSRGFMRVMFRSVQGWKKQVPSRVNHFSLTGVDGSYLEGAVKLSEKTNVKGVMLLCHPFLKYGMHFFFSTKMDVKFSEQGFHVVLFNFKGFGNSNIKGHSFSDDVLSMSGFIEKEFPELPIHLLGCSFGGYHLSHALALNSSSFSSVILDSVPCTIDAYFRKGFLSSAMNWVSNSKLSKPTGTNPISQTLKDVKNVPITFLYGEKDKYISQKDINALKISCSQINFISFADCGHLEIFKKYKKNYFKIIMQICSDTDTEIEKNKSKKDYQDE